MRPISPSEKAFRSSVTEVPSERCLRGRRQMIALDPDTRARSTARHKGSAALWQPQPGMACECVATFLEAAVKNKNFQAVRRIEMKVCVRMPSFERNILADHGSVAKPQCPDGWHQSRISSCSNRCARGCGRRGRIAIVSRRWCSQEPSQAYVTTPVDCEYSSLPENLRARPERPPPGRQTLRR